MGDNRLGDNLYTESAVAVDADSGALKWHFQFTPHDEFDWDATQIPVLLDADVGGRARSLLLAANRNGFYYVLDRETGAFVHGVPFARQNWAQRLDESGHPVVNGSVRPTAQGTTVYPGVMGAINWESASYSPITGLMYVPAMEEGGIAYSAAARYDPGRLFLGGAWQPIPNESPRVAVRALDPVTGEKKWEYSTRVDTMGGLLSTAGGLVFGSHGPWFFALDATTGRELWRFNTGGQIAAAPITVVHDGRQLLIIMAGRNILTFGL
jgi:alcohol dehydrogenase (cytochrome c)